MTFLKNDLNDQRKTMDVKPMEVFAALANVVEKASEERQIMLLVLTTLDGILTDDKKSVKNALIQYNNDNAAFLE